ncbi:MAG: phenylalanine--tRNA ligase subunit beta [Magnetovibrionaceae bacterium]
MKFTLSWLKAHLDTDATLDEITDKLTLIGLELEGVEDRAAGLESFVIAEVVSAEQHPDADKLRVCQVNTGSETLQVVCGAPNARAGLKGVFAASGAYVPGIDMTLKKATIRGVESNGMLLSEREMGISDEHEGIIDLDTDAVPGASAVEVMGLNDPVIDIAITPNRGDCLGVRGVARDLAAAGMGTLKPLDTTAAAGSYTSPISVTIQDDALSSGACSMFVGRYFRGVKNVESPDWLKERLLSVGLRPISALVDITNLMNIDLCRPLHVFDADKLNGNINVRLAVDGEKLDALNDKTYDLEEGMTVIADEVVPAALAGVIGGSDTGCELDTTNVFLETALFDPVRTAATGRKLQLITDARFRFERGIDSAFLVDGTEIATRLIMELCGGEPSELVIAGEQPSPQDPISFRFARVAELGGVDVPRDEIVRILEVLGFCITGEGDQVSVSIPTWRNDIVGEACLVEEVIRIHGLDKIPAVSLPTETALPKPALSAEQRRRSDVRRLLATRGLVEAVTYSFLPTLQAEQFGGGDEPRKLANPISSDLDSLRPSLLPNLITAAARNADRGQPNGALFELGPQFDGGLPGEQQVVCAGIRSGQTGPRHWDARPRNVDAFDAKSDALAALEALGAPVASLQVVAEAPSWYHPGRSGSLKMGPKTVLATFGEAHPGVLKTLDAKGPVAAFEIFPEALPKPKPKKSAAKPLLKLDPLQPVERDFAFVLDAGVAAEDVVRSAKGADKNLIADVRIFDLFEGESLGEGKKSLAITVVLQPKEQTLTDADLEALGAKVVAAVEKRTGGTLRG